LVVHGSPPSARPPRKEVRRSVDRRPTRGQPQHEGMGAGYGSGFGGHLVSSVRVSLGWIRILLILTFVFSPNTRRRQLEIHLLQFTTGTCHESAKVPVMQLEFEGKFDRSFEAHLEVMGDYLVVLLAHGSLFRGYQTLYLLDWTRGQLICVSTFFPTSLSRLL
jgi:hypothetical protein